MSASHLNRVVGDESHTDPLFQPLGPSSLQLTARFSRMLAGTSDWGSIGAGAAATKEATARRVMREAVMLTMMPACGDGYSLVQEVVCCECDEVLLK